MAKEKPKEREERKEAKEEKRKEAKEKTGRGYSLISVFKTARARTRTRGRLPCTCTYREAGDAAAEIVANCFLHRAADFALWAWYCRHFDRRAIVDRAYYCASCQRQGEVRNAVTAFQAWLRKEFGAKGGAA